MTTTTLHRFSADGELADRLNEFMQAVSSELVGMAVTPRAFVFLLLRPGAMESPPDGTYELRAFCEKAEFRWRKVGGVEPRAAVLSETAIDLGDEWSREPLECIDTIKRCYVLWGKQHGSADEVGWSVLAEGRVGQIRVPVVLTADKEYARIEACEYVASESEHGNAYVAEERLIRLAPYSPEPAPSRNRGAD